MAKVPQQRILWTTSDNDLIVADYFDMFGRDAAGERVNRLERNRALQDLTGRTKGSIERKRMNISGVLADLGMDWFRSFAPNDHYQTPLADAVQRYLDRHPQWVDDTGTAALVSAETALQESAPPTRGDTKPDSVKPALERIARKYNHAERDLQNRRLGRIGEEKVFNDEKRRLLQLGLDDLAKDVEWTSEERGDGLGYDILSFETNGTPRHIEVKTTNGSRYTPFFLTRTERDVSEENRSTWHLYRLHDMKDAPGIFKLRPPLEDFLHLRAETWRASF